MSHFDGCHQLTVLEDLLKLESEIPSSFCTMSPRPSTSFLLAGDVSQVRCFPAQLRNPMFAWKVLHLNTRVSARPDGEWDWVESSRRSAKALSPLNPVRLSLALNFSVFLHEASGNLVDASWMLRGLLFVPRFDFVVTCGGPSRKSIEGEGVQRPSERPIKGPCCLLV